MKTWWTRELPSCDAGGLGLFVALGAIAVHLLVAGIGPDGNGFLFHGGVVREALGQSALLSAPMVAVYLGARGVRRDRDDFVAYLALTAGALLGLLTGVGCVIAFAA